MAINVDQSEATATMRTVSRRILPFLFVLYVVNYIDRANIGFAALEMNKELGLSSQAFGLAAGLFFWGYFLFEVPSNMALARFGARRWIARILVSWGILATVMAFVHSPMQLYVLRFLLGVAEAGFFPGIVVYLTYWFRKKEVATATALFLTAIPAAYIIAAPLSALIIDHIDWFGLSGWRWMFILEGVPAVALGIACFFVLTEKPADAKWLTERQRQWLTAELETEQQANPHARKLSTLKVMADPKVLLLAVIYFVYQAGSLGVGYWLPQIVKEFSAGLGNTAIGFISAIPYVVAALGMVWWSRHSDRLGERKLHSAIPLGLAAVTLIAAGFAHSPVLGMTLIALSLTGMYSFKSPFWALPTLFLTRSTAAVAVAVVNSIGNLGGFFGPYAIGWAKGSSGSATGGLLLLGALTAVAFVLTLAMRIGGRPQRSADRQSAPGEPQQPSSVTR
ncbi:MFS transporter [Streptomyces sp. Li-HN-5-11]|uniref:MFS transporter n=1 Tax=Streptomyces sp. Li-HN-5-11 TaxID=3075432 RepID=UPI0028A60B06|nr:MFS transporter [Streptomyces sp. Li-HN-5-11]WNM34788.1 MFS transporter [Streptomyces sp. Li-HN-5-11]